MDCKMSLFFFFLVGDEINAIYYKVAVAAPARMEEGEGGREGEITSLFPPL